MSENKEIDVGFEIFSVVVSFLKTYMILQSVIMLATMTTYLMVKVSGEEQMKCSTESIAGMIFFGSRIGCEIMYPRFK